MKTAKPPEGWDEAKVRRVLEHYENQSEEEAALEDEAAFASGEQSVVTVPVELLPRVREMIAEYGQRVKA
ncbi:hypothetical protein BH24DEI1_BH24DEI1_11020 [soil metagenome]|jgi:hypothetical protein